MRTAVVISVAVALALGGTKAQAQTLFGSRGPVSQFGSNARGSFAGRSTTLGTSVFSGVGSSLGGLTQGLQTPGGLVVGGVSSGQAGRAEGFVGRDDSAGRFVGNQLAGQQRLNRSPRGTFARFAAPGQMRRFRPTTSPSRTPGSQAASTMFRPQVRVGFSYSPVPPSQLALQVQQRLVQMTQRDGRWNQVQVRAGEQGTVILEGQVASPEARKLLVALVRLEPGVRRVEDRLQVVAQRPSQP